MSKPNWPLPRSAVVARVLAEPRSAEKSLPCGVCEREIPISSIAIREFHSRDCPAFLRKNGSSGRIQKGVSPTPLKMRGAGKVPTYMSASLHAYLRGEINEPLKIGTISVSTPAIDINDEERVKEAEISGYFE